MRFGRPAPTAEHREPIGLASDPHPYAGAAEEAVCACLPTQGSGRRDRNLMQTLRRAMAAPGASDEPPDLEEASAARLHGR
jgi:hypothetical protein